jgi:hypothetical protein
VNVQIDPNLSLWADALARQQALRSEATRERLAAEVSKITPHPFRTLLAGGLRLIADWLDPQAHHEQPSTATGDAHRCEVLQRAPLSVGPGDPGQRRIREPARSGLC